jgi:Arc/MetJ-type ribon-helix-helix transcriptional regulator
VSCVIFLCRGSHNAQDTVAQHHVAARNGSIDQEQGRKRGYATESEVIRDGLRALQERDAAVEHWLRTEGVARYDAYHADPSRLMSAEETWNDLQEHIKARNRKRKVAKAG